MLMGVRVSVLTVNAKSYDMPIPCQATFVEGVTTIPLREVGLRMSNNPKCVPSHWDEEIVYSLINTVKTGV